jgi:hypothetical protein
MIAARADGVRGTADDLEIGPLRHVPVVGAFVTLRKQGELRSCIGNFGQGVPLGDALARAAQGAVAHDPRFPAVQPAELPQLDVELSLLHSRQLLSPHPDSRREAVVIGRHGLDLQHPRGTGLLLPHVPLGFGWDVEQFLQAVCQKASLPPDAWQDPETALYRFEALQFDAPFAP